MTKDGSTFLLLQQQVAQAMELVDHVANANHHNFGVQVSGPHGIGKSAVGLLAYLTCVARGLPAVYIPNASLWFEAAGHGSGLFFMEVCWQQNADLIVQQPYLRRAFWRWLTGQTVTENGAIGALRLIRHSLLHHRRSGVCPNGMTTGMAVIVDEAQHITRAIEGGAAEWITRAFQDFHPMFIASDHARMDATMVGTGRLRLVYPLGDADCRLLLRARSTPTFVREPRLRRVVARITGGVLGSMVSCADFIVKHPMLPIAEAADKLKKRQRGLLRAACEAWLASQPALDVEVRLLSPFGRVRLNEVAGLYDAGVVCCRKGMGIHFTSSFAASILYRMLSDVLGEPQLRQLIRNDLYRFLVRSPPVEP